MSTINDVEKSASDLKKNNTLLTPLYQKITSKFLALVVMLIIIVGLTLVLFYQSNVQKKALIATQLVSVTQALKQIDSLQKIDELVTDLLQPSNAENLVGLHGELITINHQLLQQKSLNEPVFLQWLHDNKLATDIVSRIQDSRTRNEQLKQSSIIQLQLVLLSIQPIIDEQLASHKLLYQQLEAEKTKKRVTYERAELYVKSIQRSNDLQQLKTLLVDALVSFQALNIYTSITSLEQLRLQIKQVLTIYKQTVKLDFTQVLSDISQQFDELENIILTAQGTLTKWQGYIRLAQDYQDDLETQQQQTRELLLTSYQLPEVYNKSVMNAFLDNNNIELPAKNIVTLLLVSISLSLLCFIYLLWRIWTQIKVSIQQVVTTPEIINPIQDIEPHLSHENHGLINQSSLGDQEKKIAELIQCNEQQKLALTSKIIAELTVQTQGYQLLKKSLVSIIQRQQIVCLNNNVFNEKETNIAIPLMLFYQQLTYFHLASEMKFETSLLRLSDINLIDEIHAILLNKQLEQQVHHNQFFISYDEQLLKAVKIDNRLFEALISLFIDIVLIDLRSSQLLLQVQLLDKNAGQQLVRFSITVNTQTMHILPNVIMQLVGTQSTSSTLSPLIDAFNVLFTKLHGENIVAQLIDDGHQLSFELPLAIASSKVASNKISLAGIHVMLFSNNSILAGLIENSILSVNGKLSRLTHYDSFDSHFSEESLTRHKFDVLVVSSDVAVIHHDFVIQKINNLPQSLRPKLMILQSNTMKYERFGFYSQAEQLFCRDKFLLNTVKILESNYFSNELFASQHMVDNQLVANQLPVLLAVQSPEAHQNLQRLLHWFGFQVQVVANESAQNTFWETGAYSLLITEFAESALVEMLSKPMVNVGVLTLTDVIPCANNRYFDDWHIAKLSLIEESTLLEMSEALAPWLQQKTQKNETTLFNQSLNNKLIVSSKEFDDVVINEVAQVFTTDNAKESVFDFSQYLQHQGSVELALFMLDDYAKNNHQQLDVLIDSIKEKNRAQAKLSITALTLNAKILSAPALMLVCIQWSELINATETSINLVKVNALLKETRIILTAIDRYAEAL
jgi:hypothetical protein